MSIKEKIYKTTFSIICSLNTSMLVVKSQSQSVDFCIKDGVHYTTFKIETQGIKHLPAEGHTLPDLPKNNKLIETCALSWAQEGSNWLKTLNMFQLYAIIVCAHHIRNVKHQMHINWALSETSNQPKIGKTVRIIHFSLGLTDFTKKWCIIWWAKNLWLQTMIPSSWRILNTLIFPILENILFLFVTHLLATRWMFVHEFVVFVIVKGWYCVTLTHLVYDGQFYCLMFSDLFRCSVFQP